MSADIGINFVATTHADTYPAIDPTKADLAGKIVLITGASKGIGRAMAVAFARAGATGLALLARSSVSATQAECEAAVRPGRTLRILALAADATDTTQVSAAIEKVRETFGRLDIVVNNAGYIGEIGLIADASPKEAWQVFAVNILGVYIVTHAALPLLLECGGDKTIINVGSMAGLLCVPEYSPYITSKTALMRFTELTMAEYRDKGVLAFCVHPGIVATDLSMSAPEEKRGNNGHFDTPEVSAHMLIWLVRERREWLAGRYVSALWDVDELAAKKQEIIEGDKLKLRMVV